MSDLIVTLTMDPALDISGNIESLMPDSHLPCDNVRAHAGGGGLNVSRAIQALGGASQAYYVAGGYTGLQLRYLLDQEGLDHHPLPIHSEIRHGVAIRDAEKGEQYRFSLSQMALSEVEWQACLDTMVQLCPIPDYLVLSSSLPEGVPHDFYAQVIRAFKPHRTKVILDVPGIEDLKPAYEEGVFLVKPAADELNAMAGKELTDDQAQVDFARQLVDECGIQVVLLSLGEAGVCVVTAQDEICIRPPDVDVVSTVGAGDTLVAGTVLALSRGLSLTDSVRYGVAASASTVKADGSGLCNREETDAFFTALNPESRRASR